MTDRTCRVPDCGSPVKGHDLCNRHLIRLRKHGSVDAYYPRARRGCSVEGCAAPHHARGWCIMHWNRWYSTGDPLLVRPPVGRDTSGELNGMWRGDEVTYNTVHWRMTRDDPAKNHVCAHCGDAASQWAYDHQDPDERSSKEGPYSVDPAHYLALCIPCHIRFDRAQDQAIRPHRASALDEAS